ncbi:MAG: hypothetical protein KGJ43_00330 [Acidobacteriota bacterium]|nr:hypothetical protein [Acidobacteriota bacterium]
MDENRTTRHRTAIFWMLAGTLHFARPRFYEAIVPPPLDRVKRPIVIASGIAELAGGAAIIPAKTRRLARAWLLATLAAVYPANIYMALAPQRFRAIPAPLLWARLPLQGLFAWITWRATE